MKHMRMISLITLLTMASLLLTGCPGDDDGPVANRTIGIYDGTGSWPEFATAVHAALDSMGRHPEYFNEGDAQTGLRDVSMVIFAGGDPMDIASALGFTGRENIHQLVTSGGGFLGLGNGSYLAADTMIYNGLGSVNAKPIGLYDGLAIGPLNAIAPAGAYAMSLVEITNTSFDPDLHGSIESLYRGGPSYEINSPVHGEISTFVQTGGASGVIFDRGLGRVALLAFHPEIEEGSPRDGTTFGDDLDDPESEWFLVRTLTEWCLREF